MRERHKITARLRLPFGVVAVFLAIAAHDGLAIPSVRSPEIHPDRQVTFRLKAPNARHVEVRIRNVQQVGDHLAYGGGQLTFPMQKDSNGVWSVTAGPFDPNYYKYTFRVDGQQWADPSNVPDRWYSGSSDQVSQLEVLAAEPRYYDFRPDVPHGAVRTHTFYSHMADSIARMIVYTPPSYDREPTRSFPVLYLFHGFSGTEFDGARRFRAPWIADNLIAEAKARELIIVMPFGHNAAVPYANRGMSLAYEGYDKYMDFIVNDVIPEVERTYRVAPGAENRAVAGMSMGGHQTLEAAFRYTDHFDWICNMSGVIRFQVTDQNADALKKFKLFAVMVGPHDYLYQANKDFTGNAIAHDVPVKFIEFEGWHDITAVRRNLRWLLPRLFQESMPNSAPTVYAGPNQTVHLPELSAQLKGAVIDDGLPNLPGAVTTAWSQVDGPGTVSLGNAGAVETTATFSQGGTYVLKLTADDGELTASDTITIWITDQATHAVTSFTLINADTDQPISGFDSLLDGAVLNLATLPTANLNIRANTNPATVGSVRFGLDGNASYSTETDAPYALAGDSSGSGDYNAWTPVLGSHTLTATSYSESGARGAAGAALSIAFDVIDDSGQTNQADAGMGGGSG